jgi:CubicO group peptidase (beta-lactamase class C family)
MTDTARAIAAAIAEQWAVPGGAVVAVDRRGELFAHRFGYADLVAGIPVGPHHLFEIGSISKIFTSIVTLRLARRGLIALDDPVGAVLDWLPETLRGAGITIERLLNHTAGLVAGVDAVPDEIGQAAAFTGTVSPAEPGTFFHYSNLGFILLGLVARHVSGRPLPDLVRDEILRPLGMTSTVARVTHDDYPSLARGYQPLYDDRPWAPGDPLVQAPWLEVAGADGNIAATASDMARFARMLLGRGTLEGTTVLDAPDFEAMVTSTAPEGEDIPMLPGVPLRPGHQHRTYRWTHGAVARWRHGGLRLVPAGRPRRWDRRLRRHQRQRRFAGRRGDRPQCRRGTVRPEHGARWRARPTLVERERRRGAHR